MSITDVKSSTAPGRICGSCSLCCKLIHVEELKKPKGEWCPHCTKSGGCGIYETRPNVCRDWNCEWLKRPEIAEEWRPIRSKMVLVHVQDGLADKLVVHVDSGSPLAWKDEPYYGQLKNWAEQLLKVNGMVHVYVRNKVFAILPNKDVDLGTFRFGDTISLRKKWNGIDWEFDVSKDQTPNQPLA